MRSHEERGALAMCRHVPVLQRQHSFLATRSNLSIQIKEADHEEEVVDA